MNFHVHILESCISESTEHEYAVTSIKKVTAYNVVCKMVAVYVSMHASRHIYGLWIMQANFDSCQADK
jgi:hypothetical protein